MGQRCLFALWGVFFILCAGLGFIPEPEGAVRIVLTIAALIFFLFPCGLVWEAGKTQNRKILTIVRNLALCSLTLTVMLLVLNILTATASRWVGDFLYGILVVVSSPMICSGHWALSMFLWACLLIATQKKLKK